MKNDFQYGGWNSYTLQCGTDIDFARWLHPAMWHVALESWIQPPKPPKLSKFGILRTHLPHRWHNFYEILSICTRLWVAFKFLIWSLSGDKQPSYKHFSTVGAFSLKFSIAPLAAKLLIRSKKVRGRVKKWYGPPLSPCQVWWGSWVSRRL